MAAPIPSHDFPKSSPRLAIAWKTILFWVAVGGLVMFSLAPILWQILTSFKVNEDISAIPNVYFRRGSR
jgi:multiple sugar transport system permease protein